MLQTVLIESLAITAPLFLLVASGYLLKKFKIIDDRFISMGAKLVFNFALPCMLFFGISSKTISFGLTMEIALVGAFVSIIAWLLFEWLAVRTISVRADRAVAVMGGFRSNIGVVGLAFCTNAFGDQGVTMAAMYLAIVTVLYNVLSVITLSRKVQGEKTIGRTLKQVLKNPLIIAICLALVWSAAGWSMPNVIQSTGDFVARMTLPLALICVGGGLSFNFLKQEATQVWGISFLKLIVFPLMALIAGVLFGLSGIALEVLVLMACAPTAAAAYPMVKAMGGNDSLMASVIAVTTIFSFATTAAMITIIRMAGLA